MKALQLKSVGNVQLIDMPPPEPGPGQVLIRTGATLICTSDLNDIHENPFHIRLPVILGHEAAGTVTAVDDGVQEFAPGDRVAAHPVHPCGTCDNCLSGMRHLCSNMSHLGFDMQGTFAEYFVARADRVRAVKPEMPFEVAALAEPVSVCLEALSQARLDQGSTLLVMGDGPFGVLIALLSADMAGVNTIIAGHHDFRLTAATGATAVNTRNVGDRQAVLLEHSGGRGYDAIILATGRPDAVSQGLALLRPKGRLVLFSAIPGQTPLDLMRVHVKEIEIIGACNDQDRLDEAVQKLSSPALHLDRLITHRFRIEDYKTALATAEHGHEMCLKVGFEMEAAK